MNYTLEQKNFICANKPVTVIEKIDFETFCASEGNDGPDMQGILAFYSEEAIEAEKAGKFSEGVNVTFHFRDTGAPMEQKYVRFYGDAQLFYDGDDEFGDYTLIAPEYVFEAVADADGRYEVTVPMWVGPAPDDDNWTLDKLVKNHGQFQFCYVFAANQFVGEQFGVVGDFTSYADNKEISKEDIRYFILSESEEDED